MKCSKILNTSEVTKCPEMSKTSKLAVFFRLVFFALIIKPFVLVFLGINVRNSEHIPTKGGMILVANHCSHLDTIVLMSLFSLKDIARIHPLAAGDYFFTCKFKSWFFRNIFGAIPCWRKPSENHTVQESFKEVIDVVNDGGIVIIYPEGTRSMDSEIHNFKTGVSRIAKELPNVPVVPFYIEGTDMILPKKDFLIVPNIVSINVGESLTFNSIATTTNSNDTTKSSDASKNSNVHAFTSELFRRVSELKEEA